MDPTGLLIQRHLGLQIQRTIHRATWTLVCQATFVSSIENFWHPFFTSAHRYTHFREEFVNSSGLENTDKRSFRGNWSSFICARHILACAVFTFSYIKTYCMQHIVTTNLWALMVFSYTQRKSRHTVHQLPVDPSFSTPQAANIQVYPFHHWYELCEFWKLKIKSLQKGPYEILTSPSETTPLCVGEKCIGKHSKKKRRCWNDNGEQLSVWFLHRSLACFFTLYFIGVCHALPLIVLSSTFVLMSFVSEPLFGSANYISTRAQQYPTRLFTELQQSMVAGWNNNETNDLPPYRGQHVKAIRHWLDS